MRNPVVKCDTYECFYNKNKKCTREGIHADKRSCYCFIHRERVR